MQKDKGGRRHWCFSVIGTLTYLVGYDETFEVVENGLIQYQDRQAFDHDDRTNFGK